MAILAIATMIQEFNKQTGGLNLSNIFGGGGSAPQVDIRPATMEEAKATVTKAYQEIFGRQPDMGGLTAYSNNLLSGAITETDMRDELKNSEEYKRKQTGGIPIPYSEAVSFVTGLYNSILKRQPTASDLNVWVTPLTKGSTTKQEVQYWITNSDEAKQVGAKSSKSIYTIVVVIIIIAIGVYFIKRK
jgi:hypothetical protein